MDEVHRLVALHADAVTGAVRCPRQLVARPIAPAFVGPSNRVVDMARRHADLSRGESDVLAPAHLRPDLALLWRRVGAEYEGAGDIGLITMHLAAAVEENDLAPFDILRLARAMRVGTCFAEQDEAPGIAPAERCDGGGE